MQQIRPAQSTKLPLRLQRHQFRLPPSSRFTNQQSSGQRSRLNLVQTLDETILRNFKGPGAKFNMITIKLARQIDFDFWYQGGVCGWGLSGLVCGLLHGHTCLKGSKISPQTCDLLLQSGVVCPRSLLHPLGWSPLAQLCSKLMEALRSLIFIKLHFTKLICQATELGNQI